MTAQSTAGARLGVGRQATLSALWFGLNFQSSALLPVVIPAQVLLVVDPGEVATRNQAIAISVLSFGAAAIAVAVTPMAGAASDKLRTRFGRRREMILAGVLAALAGQAGLAAMTPLFVFAIGFAVMQAGTNVATAAYQGLLPDVVAQGQRGAASGWLGLMTLLGSVGSLACAGAVLGAAQPGVGLTEAVMRGSRLFYAVAAVVLLVSAAVTVVGVVERDRAPAASTRWVELLRRPSFRLVFVARALVMVGLTLFLTYIEYYLAAINGPAQFVGATVAVALLALVGALVSSLVLGVASDRVPRVPIVVGANLAMALAAWVFVFAPSGTPLAPLGLLFGLGYGAYLSVDWALAIDTLTSAASSARDLGIFSVSINLPTLIAPALGGIVIFVADATGFGAFAYRAVFTLAAIALLAGALVVRKVRIA